MFMVKRKWRFEAKDVKGRRRCVYIKKEEGDQLYSDLREKLGCVFRFERDSF
ncbi:unnamed protein product [Brassica oleracea]